jgi:hypothetical protein
MQAKISGRAGGWIVIRSKMLNEFRLLQLLTSLTFASRVSPSAQFSAHASLCRFWQPTLALRSADSRDALDF